MEFALQNAREAFGNKHAQRLAETVTLSEAKGLALIEHSFMRFFPAVRMTDKHFPLSNEHQ